MNSRRHIAVVASALAALTAAQPAFAARAPHKAKRAGTTVSKRAGTPEIKHAVSTVTTTIPIPIILPGPGIFPGPIPIIIVPGPISADGGPGQVGDGNDSHSD
jgi:hypothetical protein